MVIFQNLSRDGVAVIENPVAVRQSFHAQQLQVDYTGQNNPTWSRELRFLHPGKSKTNTTFDQTSYPSTAQCEGQMLKYKF